MQIIYHYKYCTIPDYFILEETDELNSLLLECSEARVEEGEEQSDTKDLEDLMEAVSLSLNKIVSGPKTDQCSK